MAPRTKAAQPKDEKSGNPVQPEEVTGETTAGTGTEEQPNPATETGKPEGKGSPTDGETTAGTEAMNFCQAMDAARGGAMLRRKSWDTVGVNPTHAVTIKQGETLPAMRVRGQMRPYAPSIEDAMGEDWYITEKGDSNG